jgi:tellurite resistance protein TerC
VFGITDDPFIVWSSNAMAVLGMRPLFFLLAGMVDLFRYLQYGLAIILGFIGLKMIVEEGTELTGWWHMPEVLHNPLLSLAVILGVLGGSVLLSKLIPEKKTGDGPTAPGHPAADSPHH